MSDRDEALDPPDNTKQDMSLEPTNDQAAPLDPPDNTKQKQADEEREE